MSAANELLVATPQGVSGQIFQHPNGDYAFRYADTASASIAVSMTMPPRREEYVSRDLHPIFQMNLPEGYVLEQLRNRLAKVATVNPMLLAISGSNSPADSNFPRTNKNAPGLATGGVFIQPELRLSSWLSWQRGYARLRRGSSCADGST